MTTEKTITVDGLRDQYVVPGAEVTTRHKLAARAAKRLAGGNRPMNIGLFDMDRRNQGDLLDLAQLTGDRSNG